MIVFTILCLIGASLGTASLVTAQTTTHGEYEFTTYISGISGAFVGTTTLSETAVNESLTTYFNTYDIETKTSQSDFRLEHNLGYIGLEDIVSYYDSNSILRKSETTYLIRLDGYQSVTYSTSYEYSTPSIIENSDTVYDRMYTQRYYEDGYLEEITDCRDITTLGATENITVPGGTFECACFTTDYHEDGIFTGYTDIWVDEDGTLIQQEQYDEDFDLVASIVLLSQPNTGLADLALSSITTGAIVVTGVAVVGIVIYFRRRKPKPKYSSYGDIPIPL